MSSKHHVPWICACFMSDLDDRQYYVIRDVTDILIYDGEYGNYRAECGYLQKELFIIVNSVLIPVGQERVEMRISWGYQMYKKWIYCNYLSWMLWSSFFNPCCAEFILKKPECTQAYLPFLNTEMSQLVEILPHGRPGRQGPVYPV